MAIFGREQHFFSTLFDQHAAALAWRPLQTVRMICSFTSLIAKGSMMKLGSPLLFLALAALAVLSPRGAVADCCFGIGFGSMMRPCCLSIHDHQTTREQCIPKTPFMGGAVGWTDGACPTDAAEANEIIQKMPDQSSSKRAAGQMKEDDDTQQEIDQHAAVGGMPAVANQQPAEEAAGRDAAVPPPTTKKAAFLAGEPQQGMAAAWSSRVENLEARMSEIDGRVELLTQQAAERATPTKELLVMLASCVFLGAGVSVIVSRWTVQKVWAKACASGGGRSLLVE